VNGLLPLSVGAALETRSIIAAPAAGTAVILLLRAGLDWVCAGRSQPEEDAHTEDNV
jgi:hypothetical protein